MPRIALIHATRVAIDPIENAARKLWPEAETVSILDEGLSADRQKSKDLSPDLRDRIVNLARYAQSIDPDGILFTCSAFGPAIEDAARDSPVPIMKPNEAVYDAAFELGNRIAMIYTFPPTAPSLEEEFKEAAAAKGSKAVLTSIFCEGALDAKRLGDDAGHDRLIAETARRITDADGIMLAQFSMADAAKEARRHTAVPVLTSPDSAIVEIRRRIGARQSVRSC